MVRSRHASTNNTIKERSCASDMPMYPGFMEKLKKLQRLCKTSDGSYKLGNIKWSDELLFKLKECEYPSKRFIKIIMATQFVNDYICNIPMIVPKSLIDRFTYVTLTNHALHTIDALWKQGSGKRYKYQDRYMYSEHSGVLSVDDKRIDKVITLANSTRVDPNDDDIYLPNNNDEFNNYCFMFHTHPNTNRLTQGIIYEFPSASDLYNFTYYYNSGKTQASIIVTQEGMYVIRPYEYVPKYDFSDDHWHEINEMINQIETDAKKLLKKVKDENTFHKYIAQDTKAISAYNDYVRKYNLYIEYYPRVFVNNEWALRTVYLPLIKDK